MEESVEYQLFIGCHDRHTRNEYVKNDDLTNLIADFFVRNKVDFSLIQTSGGYLYSDGSFAMENGVCVSLVGAQEEDVVRLSKSLSMYMNQENALIIRNKVSSKSI